MIADYFEYERALWHDSMLPSLRALGLSFERQRVLDVGCGHGGILRGLGESYAISEAIGGLATMIESLDVAVLDRARYLVRPDYRLKFGLPTIALPTLPEPVAELLCTGETLVLRRNGSG